MNRKSIYLSLFLVVIFSSSVDAQDFNTAREVLEANVEATGGSDAWKAIKSSTLKGTRVLDTPMGERKADFTTYNRYPGYSRTDEVIHSPMGEMEQVMVSTPEGRWTNAMGGTRELPARSWIVSESAKDELFLLSDDRVELGSLETEIDETGPVFVVSFTFEGESYKRKYNQFTLLLTAAEAPGNDGSKNWTSYDDYREIDGFHIPHAWNSVASITINRGGGESTSTITVVTKLESIAFNDTLSDDLFVK